MSQKFFSVANSLKMSVVQNNSSETICLSENRKYPKKKKVFGPELALMPL